MSLHSEIVLLVEVEAEMIGEILFDADYLDLILLQGCPSLEVDNLLVENKVANHQVLPQS